MIETITLKNNWIIQFPVILDGGGVEQRKFFVNKIQSLQKTYKKGLEWCAGMGIIGYDIMAHDLCDHMSFNDFYEPAITNVNRNAAINKIKDRVSTYLGKSISVIPESEKFDLAISNPPHSNSLDSWKGMVIKSMKDRNEEIWSEDKFDNWARLIVDEQWESHYNFFKNIRKYLTDDADIFICENGSYEILENLFKQEFYIVSIEEFPPLGINGLLYHLKVKV